MEILISLRYPVSPQNPSGSGTLANVSDSILRYTMVSVPKIDPGVGADAAGATIFVNVYDPLVMPAHDGSVTPWIATSWEVSDDSLVWTFHLRDDVTFHSGNKLTAKDVAYTMNRMLDLGEGFGENNPKAPTDDVHIRRTLAYMVDYSAITQSVFPLMGYPFYMRNINLFFALLLGVVSAQNKNKWPDYIWRTAQSPIHGGSHYRADHSGRPAGRTARRRVGRVSSCAVSGHFAFPGQNDAGGPDHPLQYASEFRQRLYYHGNFAGNPQKRGQPEISAQALCHSHPHGDGDGLRGPVWKLLSGGAHFQLAITVMWWPWYARLSYGIVTSLRSENYIVYAEFTGARLDHIQFSVTKGENVGLVGESGCGKTTALRVILRVLPSNTVVESGEIFYNGRDVFQMRSFRNTARRGRHLLLADEPGTALDVSAQAKVIGTLLDLQKKMELSYLFITHDLSLMRNVATRVAILYLGRLCELAATEEEEKMKPAAVSSEGEIPSPINAPKGCAFHTRCRDCMEICGEQAPEMTQVAPGHFVCCHKYAAKEGHP